MSLIRHYKEFWYFSTYRNSLACLEYLTFWNGLETIIVSKTRSVEIENISYTTLVWQGESIARIARNRCIDKWLVCAWLLLDKRTQRSKSKKSFSTARLSKPKQLRANKQLLCDCSTVTVKNNNRCKKKFVILCVSQLIGLESITCGN